MKLSPIFTSGKMKMMFETVDIIGDKLVDVLRQRLATTDTLETREIAGNYTADVIGNVAFGIECKCEYQICHVWRNCLVISFRLHG